MLETVLLHSVQNRIYFENVSLCMMQAGFDREVEGQTSD